MPKPGSSPQPGPQVPWGPPRSTPRVLPANSPKSVFSLKQKMGKSSPGAPLPRPQTSGEQKKT